MKDILAADLENGIQFHILAHTCQTRELPHLQSSETTKLLAIITKAHQHIINDKESTTQE